MLFFSEGLTKFVQTDNFSHDFLVLRPGANFFIRNCLHFFLLWHARCSRSLVKSVHIGVHKADSWRDDMQTENIREFFKWCYEVGNTPIWTSKPKPKSTRRRRSVSASSKRKRKSKTVTEIRRPQFVLDGEISRGLSSEYAVKGEDFQLTADTWVLGNIILGKRATVRGIICTGGVKQATKIVVKS